MEKSAIIEKLREMGLTKSQIESTTCQKVIEAMMPEDMAAMLDHFRTTMNNIMKKSDEKAVDVYRTYMELEHKVQTMADSVAQTTSELAKMDDRAMSAFVLYSSILKASLSIRDKANHFSNGSMDELNVEVVKTAGYIVYAYLGGQARRIYEGSEVHGVGRTDDF